MGGLGIQMLGKNTIFWDVIAIAVVEVYCHSRGTVSIIRIKE
jgi:hypothetical protein